MSKKLKITLPDGTSYVVNVEQLAQDISEHITSISPTEAPYTGEEIKPTVIDDGTVTLNTDYSVAYSDNVLPGTGKVTVTGKNDYSGSKVFTFEISETRGNIADHITGVSPTVNPYTGSEIKPTVLTDGTVALDTDYTVAYSGNINVGTGTATITGKGNYLGSVYYTFDIVSNDIADHITGLEKEEYTYTGSEIKPTVVNDGKVVLDTDYTVAYSDNTVVGTGKVTVTGKGSYTGSKEITFDITEADVESHILRLEHESYPYTGSEIKPVVVDDGTVTLNTDYEVSYEDNTVVGTGKTIVDGINNYAGYKEIEFAITAADITSHIIGLDKEEYTYTGEEIKPDVVDDGTVTLDTDYTVTYSDNTEVGTGKATVAGKGNYTGSTELTFTIKAAE